MRKQLALAAGLCAGLGILVFAPISTSASAASKAPVTLSGKTNKHGSKDVSAKATATLEVEQDDFYFSPTFVKVQAGEQLTIKLHNEGKSQHTFTSSALGVDTTVNPGKRATVKITIPAGGGTLQFHCDFHEAMGMQGAFYTSAGDKVS